MKYDYLIVGSGFFGSICAYELSRIGKNCKVVLSGDPKQVDIIDSGLEDAVHRLTGLPNVEVIKFLDEDIVRSLMCKQIILAYNN
jgi:phosphate starvation-inducible PhoH-like protein